MARKPRAAGPTAGAGKRPRKPRTRPDAPGADAPGIGDNSRAGASRLTPDQERELFLSHRTTWNAWQAKLKAVEAIGIDVKAALKADGFTVKQMQIADDLATVKGEARVVGEVTDRLKVARWIGHAMGAQLDLFEQPDRTPIVDRAYDEGKQASMENKPRSPPHAPGTAAYDAWMNGYSDHQEELASKFKRDGESPPDSAGAPLSREEFKRDLAQTTAAGDAIAKGGVP